MAGAAPRNCCCCSTGPTRRHRPKNGASLASYSPRSRQEYALVDVERDLDFIRDICDVLDHLDQGKVVAHSQGDPALAQVRRSTPGSADLQSSLYYRTAAATILRRLSPQPSAVRRHTGCTTPQAQLHLRPRRRPQERRC